MRYPLVVFDFDGTLADSAELSLLTFNRIAPGLGLRPLTDLEAARRTPTKKLLKQLGVRFWQLPRVVRAFQEAVADHAADLKLHPGVSDMLHRLHADGCRLGVLSSNRESTIRICLREHGVETLFAFVVGYPKLFGKAKALRKILKAEKCGRDALLYVGDELRDLHAGQKLGIATAAVTWGFQAAELLEAAGPTLVIRHPNELGQPEA